MAKTSKAAPVAAKTTKKASAPLALTVRFELERETKGAIRYMEVDEDQEAVEGDAKVIGTLYIRKTAFKGKVPTALTVTIS